MDGWMDGWVDGLLSMCHMLTDSNSAANSKIEKRPCGSLCGSAGCSMRIIHPHDAGTSRRQRTVEPTPNHTQKRREGRTLLERAAEKQGLFVPPLLQQCCSARCACCLSLHLHLRHHRRRTQPPPTRACSVFFANDPAGKRLSHTDTHALAVRVDEAQARSKGDAARARTSCTCSIDRSRGVVVVIVVFVVVDHTAFYAEQQHQRHCISLYTYSMTMLLMMACDCCARRRPRMYSPRSRR